MQSLRFSDMYFFPLFFAYTFLWNIVLGTFQWIWNQHKILRYWTPNTNFVKKCLSHISTYYKSWIQMLKKWIIFNHFAKSKNLLFAAEVFQVRIPSSFENWSSLLYSAHCTVANLTKCFMESVPGFHAENHENQLKVSMQRRHS